MPVCVPIQALCLALLTSTATRSRSACCMYALCFWGFRPYSVSLSEVLLDVLVCYTRAHQNSAACPPGDTPATQGASAMSSRRLRKGSRMETVTDIAVQDCFVIHVRKR